eukprot:scaffold32232_cov17-Tisochrysis_lutea.AAC.1
MAMAYVGMEQDYRVPLDPSIIEIREGQHVQDSRELDPRTGFDEGKVPGLTRLVVSMELREGSDTWNSRHGDQRIGGSHRKRRKGSMRPVSTPEEEAGITRAEAEEYGERLHAP